MQNRYYFPVAFVFFLLIMAGMLWTEKRAECGSSIIIPLELAPDIESFKSLLAPACKLEWIERNTKLDFMFLISYTLVILAAFHALANSPKDKWLKPVCILSVFPAVFDAVENIHLLKFLKVDIASVTTAEYSVYYWCVHLKFALLLFIVAFILVLAVKRLASTFSK